MPEQDNISSRNLANKYLSDSEDISAELDTKITVSSKMAYSPKFAVITVLSIVIITGLVLLLIPEKNTSTTDQTSNSIADSLKGSIQSLLPEPSLDELNELPASLENSRSSGLIKRADNQPEASQSSVSTDQDLFQADSDADGLLDRLEARYKTDPQKTDTDNDGLSDLLEIYVHKTDPLAADTDNDGYSDQQEVDSGYNPNGPG
ncbi:MAG: hypothetical protein V1853_02540 [bacterium]